MRQGERLLDSLASVEDAKGGVLSKGTLMVEQAPAASVWRPALNMLIAVGCVVVRLQFDRVSTGNFDSTASFTTHARLCLRSVSRVFFFLLIVARMPSPHR